MREALVKQAMTFLANPGLASTPWEKKKSFLEGKGLSEEEIEEARRRSEEKEATPSPLPPTAPASPLPAAPLRAPPVGPAPPPGPMAPRQPLPASAISQGLVPTPEDAAGSSARVALLLRRRLAELDHERACYMEALGAIGAGLAPQQQQPPGIVSPPAPVSAPSVANPPSPPVAASTTAVAPAAVPKVLATSPVSPPAKAPSVSSAPAGKKPWETSSGPGSGSGGSSDEKAVTPTAPVQPQAPGAATTGGGSSESLRDDDPDLMEILPGKKPGT